MIPKRNRIPRKDFGEIIKSKKFFHSPHFLLRVAEFGQATKVAVSVSKKISKSAVVRNTVRRRTYSVIQKIIPDLREGLYLFSVKKGAEKIKELPLEHEIETLLKTSKRR